MAVGAIQNGTIVSSLDWFLSCWKRRWLTFSRPLISGPSGDTRTKIFNRRSRAGHFGHYKAASHNRYLSAMHDTKLTLAATTRIPLARWGKGLTVLLEKVFVNIYIDKMCAICLLEVDYNWINKFVFAKQMMDKAFQGEIIPAEQFAKRGSQATEGVVTSGLFCDIVRALHKTADRKCGSG